GAHDAVGPALGLIAQRLDHAVAIVRAQRRVARAAARMEQLGATRARLVERLEQRLLVEDLAVAQLVARAGRPAVLVDAVGARLLRALDVRDGIPRGLPARVLLAGLRERLGLGEVVGRRVHRGRDLAPALLAEHERILAAGARIRARLDIV